MSLALKKCKVLLLTVSILMVQNRHAFAQKGIRFENNLSWAQIQAKAKAENKYIFADCFTTWCGPCKFMSNTVFTQEVMGNYFNDKFISVQIQMDKTAGDNDYVKSWYNDAASIAKEYAVSAYPTFLYFSPDGKIVHRVVGGGEAQAFIARSAKALNPETQYYTLLGKYKAGNNKPEDMRNMALAALEAYDEPVAKTAATQYLQTQSNLYTKENIGFLDKITTSGKDKGFAIFLNESKKVDAILGEGKAAAKVKDIVAREEIYPALFAKNFTGDWAPVAAAVKEKYPQLADEMISYAKVQYYMVKKDWTSFQSEIVGYMKKYGQKATPEQLNTFAWSVFENCADKNCVKKALEWSKRSFAEKEDPSYMDTYANLLYKLGRKEEAIAIEEKAVKRSNGEKSLVETLEKMKKGEPASPTN